MAGHVSTVVTKLRPGMIKSVPGLEARLKEADPDFDIKKEDTFPQAWSCANTCNDVKLFGVTFMVDFCAKTIIEDPTLKPCDRAVPAAGGAGAAASSSDKPRIRHGKVEVNGIFASFKLSKTGRPPQAGVFDESLVAAVSPEKALLLQSPDKVPPSSFITSLRTLAIQLGNVMAANCSALATTMVSQKTERVERVRGLHTLIHANAPSSGEFSLDIPNKNNITLICTQRGVLEIADYAALAHRTLYPTLNFHDFMAQLFEKYRPDMADITEIIDAPEKLVLDISANLDNNVFYVLGARLIADQKTALHAFFRRERPRYDDVAKKMGFKPSTPSKGKTPSTPKTSSTPPAARPSPVLGKRDRDRGDDADSDADDDQPNAKDARSSGTQRGPRRFRGGKAKGGKKGKGGAAGASATFSR